MLVLIPTGSNRGEAERPEISLSYGRFKSGQSRLIRTRQVSLVFIFYFFKYISC